MTSAHITPHIENFSKSVSQFHDHIQSGHEDPQGGICDGINSFALHFLQLAAQVKKSFPEAERHHFYADLDNEAKAALIASQKFLDMKPTFLTQGIKASDIVLALEGEQIALIAMFENLKAADPKYEEHCTHIEKPILGRMQSCIDAYSKA